MSEQATLWDYARAQVKRRCPNKSIGSQCELKAEHRGYHEAQMEGCEGRKYWTPWVREPLHPVYCTCARWCAPRAKWEARMKARGLL